MNRKEFRSARPERMKPYWHCAHKLPYHLFFIAFSLMAPFHAGAATISLDFSSAIPGTIQDASGQGTGFTSRLPGTGAALGTNDPNLVLNTSSHNLTLQTTDANLHTGSDLDVGEFLGVSLASLGFTGMEDFTVSATFSGLQYSEQYDQIGLFVGADSTRVFRGGALSMGAPRGYTVNNNGGGDFDLVLQGDQAPQVGDTVTWTLSRISGVYSFQVTDLTNPGFSGSIGIASQPVYLDGLSNLYVGIYGANPGNSTSKTETLTSFSATVAPEAGTVGLVVPGLLILGLCTRVRSRRGRLHQMVNSSTTGV